jgi:hypothetical protein
VAHLSASTARWSVAGVAVVVVALLAGCTSGGLGFLGGEERIQAEPGPYGAAEAETFIDAAFEDGLMPQWVLQLPENVQVPAGAPVMGLLAIRVEEEGEQAGQEYTVRARPVDPAYEQAVIMVLTDRYRYVNNEVMVEQFMLNHATVPSKTVQWVEVLPGGEPGDDVAGLIALRGEMVVEMLALGGEYRELAEKYLRQYGR